jgi:hypothetical protein
MLATVKADQIHECVLATLEAAAVSTGDARYRVARAIAAGAPGGRPAKADAALLETMTAALACARAPNPARAARLALREAGAEEPNVAAVKRLTRKYRDQHKEPCHA